MDRDSVTKPFPSGQSPIQCVAFDAVGTLIYPEPSVSQVYWSVGQQYGSQLSPDAVRTGFYRAFEDLARGIRGDYSTSESEERERWRQIVHQVLPDVHDADGCFEQLHWHFGQPAAWRAFPDVAETLSHIQARGLQLMVASNFDERLHPLCDALPELKPLQQRVISACVGWHKPSPHFYTQVIAAAGCPPESILMVGDDLENDVTSAQASGLQAIWIERRQAQTPQSISDLRQLLELLDRH